MGREASDEVSFDTEPSSYRHWRLETDGPVATLTMAVSPEGGLRPGYELKLNSYDLAVDIELCDAVQRLRFEHPEVKAVVLTSGLENTFCAGANIQMLASSDHPHKVNFCKFTNETRNAIEDATANSGQTWIAAVNGTAAGGGYELALACDEILLIDDRSSAVSLPEVPLLAVLPGTGGLTRLVDKRFVRRDLADAFCTRAEGAKAKQALEWGLVDHTAPPSGFAQLVRERVLASVGDSDRSANGRGVTLAPLRRPYTHVSVRLEPELGTAHITVRGPVSAQPSTPEELIDAGASGWLLAAVRELDDAMLRLRFNEPELGTWVMHTEGDSAAVATAEEPLLSHSSHWLVRELRLYWARTLRRLDHSARSIIALIEPGSCYAGLLADVALAADRTFMLDAAGGPQLLLSDLNDGALPMSNGLSRIASRFLGHEDLLACARDLIGKDLTAAEAASAGLVTFTPDELDWDDEVRLTLEERNGFSPDALTGLEANLRFAGPETVATKVFGRLSAWQNWIFQRPGAAGSEGALRSYGTGSRPRFDRSRT